MSKQKQNPFEDGDDAHFVAAPKAHKRKRTSSGKVTSKMKSVKKSTKKSIRK